MLPLFLPRRFGFMVWVGVRGKTPFGKGATFAETHTVFCPPLKKERALYLLNIRSVFSFKLQSIGQNVKVIRYQTDFTAIQPLVVDLASGLQAFFIKKRTDFGFFGFISTHRQHLLFLPYPYWPFSLLPEG
jgi:hypothetical protein